MVQSRYSICITLEATEMPRCFSISIQSEVAWRAALRAFTEPAIWIAPENSSSFSVSVVNLPDVLRERFPLAANNADELVFGHNNSSIRVATSMRSGTLHRLHISEFGKICAKYPDKAKEVMTGSIPSVPTNGILIIES